jgi:hypothetical protein
MRVSRKAPSAEIMEKIVQEAPSDFVARLFRESLNGELVKPCSAFANIQHAVRMFRPD